MLKISPAFVGVCGRGAGRVSEALHQQLIKKRVAKFQCVQGF